MRRMMLAATVLVAVASTGCGDVPRGRLHGTVKLRGKPLSHATVIFLAKDNKTHLAKLKPDGTFDVSGVALGPVKVSIQADLPAVNAKGPPGTRTPSSQAKGVTDEKASKAATTPPRTEKLEPGVNLPSQYTDPEQSGLAFELNSADQEWSVDLK